MKKQLLLTFILSIILTAFYTWHHAQARGVITLNVRLSAVTDIKRPILQIFFDIGKGYQEHDSHRFLLSPNEKTQNFLYTIQSSVIYGLRLDYLNGPGSVLLEELQFISSSGDEILSITVPENPVVNQTSVFRPAASGIAVLNSSAGANDPYVVLPFSEPFVSPAAQIDLPRFLFGVKIFCVLFVGISLIFMFTGSWFDRTCYSE